MITAQDISQLRQQTGAGVMDCKRALTEANGDHNKAMEILRKKGQKVSAARSNQATTEGVVFAKTDVQRSFGVMLALSCETDFVARNALFQQFGQTVLDIAFENRPTTLEGLLKLNAEGGVQVKESITNLVGKLGEKVAITAYATLGSETVVSYIHVGSKLGVLVGLSGGSGTAIMTAGRDVAMQVAAMNPMAVHEDGIDATFVDKELAKGSVLLRQPFIKDGGITVAQYLARISPNLDITAFERVSTAG